MELLRKSIATTVVGNKTRRSRKFSRSRVFTESQHVASSNLHCWFLVSLLRPSRWSKILFLRASSTRDWQSKIDNSCSTVATKIWYSISEASDVPVSGIGPHLTPTLWKRKRSDETIKISFLKADVCIAKMERSPNTPVRKRKIFGSVIALQDKTLSQSTSNS